MKKGIDQETAFKKEPFVPKPRQYVICTHGVWNPVIDPVKKLVQSVCDKCIQFFSQSQEALVT